MWDPCQGIEVLIEGEKRIKLITFDFYDNFLQPSEIKPVPVALDHCPNWNPDPESE